MLGASLAPVSTMLHLASPPPPPPYMEAAPPNQANIASAIPTRKKWKKAAGAKAQAKAGVNTGYKAEVKRQPRAKNATRSVASANAAGDATKCDELRVNWCASHCGRSDLVPTFRDRGSLRFAWRCEPPGLSIPANSTFNFCGAYSVTSAKKLSRTRSRESNHLRTISQSCHGHRFLLNVRKPAPAPCSEEAYARALALAKVLGDDLHSTAERFAGHGYLGVFSPDYSGAKTRFIFDTMCRGSDRAPIRQICEIGFNAGESAVLFLETAPQARVVSFDFGDKPWTRRQGEVLKRAYGDRFELRIGSSESTLPKYNEEQQTLEAASRRPCDVALIDGAKTFQGRLTDLRNMQKASRTPPLLFLDEVASVKCATGELPLEKCNRARSTTQLPPMRAYHQASRDGLLKIDKCAFPAAHPDDGFCSATLKVLP